MTIDICISSTKQMTTCYEKEAASRDTDCSFPLALLTLYRVFHVLFYSR